MISVQHLTHRFAEEASPVLDDVCINLPAGEVTALVGPNGAGKSTLLAAMARLLTPTSGRVLLDGVNVATAPARDIAQRIAILRQENSLTARLTVVDLVSFGRFPHSGGKLSHHDHNVVKQCLAYLQLDQLQDRYVDELSGGQRQRVFIAMVLAQETNYVLLDEPLNNLDMRHSANMMALLRNVCDELGRTVVLVLHDINIAASYCDRIVGLRDGAVVVNGPAGEVMHQATLEAVFGTQITVHDVAGQRVALHWLGQETPEKTGGGSPQQRSTNKPDPS